MPRISNFTAHSSVINTFEGIKELCLLLWAFDWLSDLRELIPSRREREGLILNLIVVFILQLEKSVYNLSGSRVEILPWLLISEIALENQQEASLAGLGTLLHPLWPICTVVLWSWAVLGGCFLWIHLPAHLKVYSCIFFILKDKNKIY